MDQSSRSHATYRRFADHLWVASIVLSCQNIVSFKNTSQKSASQLTVKFVPKIPTTGGGALLLDRTGRERSARPLNPEYTEPRRRHVEMRGNN